MSAMGTGVAAGVAQAALQSQQLGRQRDVRNRQTQRTADRQKEIAQVRVQGLEEVDHAEDATRIRIDNQVPDHERHDQPQRRNSHRQDSNETANADQPAPLPAAPPDAAAPVEGDVAPEPQSHVAAAYRHSTESESHRLDVEG